MPVCHWANSDFTLTITPTNLEHPLTRTSSVGFKTVKRNWSTWRNTHAGEHVNRKASACLWVSSTHQTGHYLKNGHSEGPPFLVSPFSRSQLYSPWWISAMTDMWPQWPEQLSCDILLLTTVPQAWMPANYNQLAELMKSHGWVEKCLRYFVACGWILLMLPEMGCIKD